MREALIGRRFRDETAGGLIVAIIGLDYGHPSYVAVSPVDGDRVWYRHFDVIAPLLDAFDRENEAACEEAFPSYTEDGDPVETCPKCGENRIDQLMNTDGAGHQFTCWTCDHVYYI
jgi:predicted RNA-binding Zn-ribbon protein involved in translation (DUF1610 family)